MQPLGVDRICCILHALQPITRNDKLSDRTYCVRPNKGTEIRKQRCRLRSQVSKDQTTQLLHRVGGNHLFANQGILTGLKWLFETATASVEYPTMIRAADAIVFRNSKPQRGPAMG